MAVEREYLEYVGFFCISILSASAAYLIDLNNTMTYIGFLIVPLAYGYSAYVSREGFRKSSLVSLMTLFLIGTSPVVSVIAVLVAFGIPLISVFSGGDSFKDYFGTVAVPLLIVGLLLGGGMYAKVSYDSDARTNLENTISEVAGRQAEIALESTGMSGNVRNAQIEVIETTSEATVAQTAQILNANMTDLDADQRQTMADSLDYAQEKIPERISSNVNSSASENNVDVSEKVSEQVSSMITGKYLLAIIPLTAMILYSLNPFIGVLTALFAITTREISERIGF